MAAQKFSTDQNKHSVILRRKFYSFEYVCRVLCPWPILGEAENLKNKSLSFCYKMGNSQPLFAYLRPFQTAIFKIRSLERESPFITS